MGADVFPTANPRRVHDIADVDAVQYEPLHLLEDLPSIDLLLGVPANAVSMNLFGSWPSRSAFPTS